MTECPRCGSPDPGRHPAVQHEGEVQICPHSFHVITELKAVVEHQFDSHRRRLTLTDAPAVQKIHMTDVEFTPTLLVIDWHRYDDGPWELNDVRAVRVVAHSTTELNLYGNAIDAMPQWILDLIHREAPRA